MCLGQTLKNTHTHTHTNHNKSVSPNTTRGINDFQLVCPCSQRRSVAPAMSLAWWTDQTTTKSAFNWHKKYKNRKQRLSEGSVFTATTTAASQQTAELISGTKLEHFPNSERKTQKNRPDRINKAGEILRLVKCSCSVQKKWFSFVPALIQFTGCVITCPTKPPLTTVVMDTMVKSLKNVQCDWRFEEVSVIVHDPRFCRVHAESAKLLMRLLLLQSLITDPHQCTCCWLQASIIDLTARKWCRNNTNDGGGVWKSSIFLYAAAAKSNPQRSLTFSFQHPRAV